MQGTRSLPHPCKHHNSTQLNSVTRLTTPIMSDLRAPTVAVNLTLIVLTSLAISCRVGRKIKIMSSFGWHDGELSLLLPTRIIILTDMKLLLSLPELAPSSYHAFRCTLHVWELAYTKQISIQPTWRCSSRYDNPNLPSPSSTY